MRVLIAMAVHNTEENKRYDTTVRCIESLLPQIRDAGHDLWVVDNASSCRRTIEYLDNTIVNLIRHKENLGTAAAINAAWHHRLPGQHAVKMDNDVVIRHAEWVEDMVEAIAREPRIGIVGLKRNDCWEHPTHENDDLRSELIMLPKTSAMRWMVIERVFHVMGTCQMYSSAFLDRIGYLYQPSLYGYDDVLAAHRCYMADMWSVFLPHIAIDHIDPGDTPYQKWKEQHSGAVMDQVMNIAREYRRGYRSIYYNPFVAE
jgi:GT2 family glycosyltransferase